MRIVREWLQKHPTPAAADGDFHWWPGAADEAVRSTIAADAAGEPGTLTVWLASDRVIAARRFAATAPADQRRYQGLAVVIADGASTTEMLAALEAPAAAPWGETSDEPAMVASVGAAAVAAVWRGGCVRVLALDDAARIEAWLPPEMRATPRRIVIGEADDALGALGPLARWLASAIASRGSARSRLQRAWRAVQGLARVEGREVAAQVAELAALDDAWATAAGVRAYLEAAGIALGARLHVAGDGRDQWARALHGWGRGWLPDTEAVVAMLARRGVADRLGDAPARRWRRILRHEALVPAARADVLEREALARVPALAEDGDG